MLCQESHCQLLPRTRCNDQQLAGQRALPWGRRGSSRIAWLPKRSFMTPGESGGLQERRGGVLSKGHGCHSLGAGLDHGDLLRPGDASSRLRRGWASGLAPSPRTACPRCPRGRETPATWL